jgi:hypothetical protein
VLNSAKAEVSGGGGGSGIFAEKQEVGFARRRCAGHGDGQDSRELNNQ